MLFSDLYRGVTDAPALLGPGAAQRARSTWERIAQQTTTSAFQLDVARMLSAMGAKPQASTCSVLCAVM